MLYFFRGIHYKNDEVDRFVHVEGKGRMTDGDPDRGIEASGRKSLLLSAVSDEPCREEEAQRPPMRSGSVFDRIQKIAKPLRSPNVIIAFSHSDYLVSLGGTEKVLHEEQMEFAKQGISYIQVYGAESNADEVAQDPLGQIVGVNVDSLPAGHFALVQLTLILQWLQSLRRLHVTAIHIHHTMNLSVPGLLYLMNILHDAKVRIFIHDYFTVCTQFNLLPDEKHYCGLDCENCESEDERIPHNLLMKRLFENTRAEFIAPSQVAADIWQKSFPEHAEKVRVIPHQIPFDIETSSSRPRETTSNDRPRIAYLGYESMCKGLETWWKLVSINELTRYYDFYHLGAAGRKMPGITYVPVSFLDDGPDAMIHALNENRIDIAFLWSIWPETYSFTLFEAFAANCFVITNEISGNIAVQVRASDRGAIYRDESELVEMLRDVVGVREMLRNHVSRNSPIGLNFNPQLVEESIDCMKPAAYFSYVEKEDLARLAEGSSDWDRFILAMELEKIRGDYIEELLRHIQELGERLSKTNYIINILHRIQELEKKLSETNRQSMEDHPVLDQLMEFLGRFPFLKRAGKAIFQVIWRVYQRIKLR
jgi:hypothetical protein